MVDGEINMDLPQSEKLEDIQKSNKKHGRLQTFLDQLQANWLSILTLIVMILYGTYNQSQLRGIKSQISNSNQNTVNAPITVGANDKSDSKEPEKGKTLGVSAEFNPSDWVIDKFETDKEGYYCPIVTNFEYWSIWSKTTYSPTPDKIRVKVLTKSKPGSKSPPTISISYGEYKQNLASPNQFYRLNIFDTDMKTLRLYDSSNRSVAQNWLNKEPELSSEMLITLSPRNANPNSRIINLNPSLEYVVTDQTKLEPYTPDNAFEVSIPTVGLDDGTIKKQIGVGSSINTCFKPIFISISE